MCCCSEIGGMIYEIVFSLFQFVSHERTRIPEDRAKNNPHWAIVLIWYIKYRLDWVLSMTFRTGVALPRESEIPIAPAKPSIPCTTRSPGSMPWYPISCKEKVNPSSRRLERNVTSPSRKQVITPSSFFTGRSNNVRMFFPRSNCHPCGISPIQGTPLSSISLMTTPPCRKGSSGRSSVPPQFSAAAPE